MKEVAAILDDKFVSISIISSIKEERLDKRYVFKD